MLYLFVQLIHEETAASADKATQASTRRTLELNSLYLHTSRDTT
jgi:hypothetical protein